MVSPGNSPGTLTVDGDVTIEEGGVLNLEVGGKEPGFFDKLVIKGKAAFEEGSKVVMNFINGYAPKAGDHFFKESEAFLDFPQVVFGNMFFGPATRRTSSLTPDLTDGFRI